jgi:hypothetical protein
MKTRQLLQALVPFSRLALRPGASPALASPTSPYILHKPETSSVRPGHIRLRTSAARAASPDMLHPS